MNTSERLNIRLTATPPDWATASVAAVRQLPYLNIVDTDESPIDVVLHFGTYSEAIRQQHGTGRLGFWFFRFAGQDLEVVSAARQSAAAGIALESSLWATLPDNNCVCLYQSFGQLDDFAVWRSVSRTLAKAACFPERVLSRYQHTGALVTCTAETITTLPSSTAGYLSQAAAILNKIIKKLFYHEQWFVVAGKGNELIPDPSKHQWLLNPPADSFWADPFPVEQDGRVWILLEVLPFTTQCGYLAAVELFADGSHGEAQTIMNTGSHLSYPFILNYQGDIYMLPEAGASREVTLWKCEQFPDRWTKAATLLTDVCFTDATLIEHNGLWWLFLTLGEEDGICLNDELSVYYADSPFGVWTAHKDNPIKSDARNARPAGNLFHRDGVLYRPSQDCGTGYGKATVLNRIDRLDSDHFSETAVGRIDADWRAGCLCAHTLSRSEHYWAIDGLHLSPRWAGLFKSK
jgi:hypothetical protein